MANEGFAFEETKRGFWRRPSLSMRGAARPAEGKAPDSASNARTAAAAMLIAFALFVLFDSKGMRHFARNLPGNAVSDVLVDGADRWQALMQRLGPAHVQPAVRAAFEQVKDVSW